METSIAQWLRINERITGSNIESILSLNSQLPLRPEAVYEQLQYNYPKFFKMDMLCKWAWLAAEQLLCGADTPLYDGLDKSKIAVVIATRHGCLDVDKRYSETTKTIPSPSLFVYTLSNIMLGEICIRHGFKGEQVCTVSEGFDSEALHFWVNDLLANRGMDACLCGWADATEDVTDVCLFWVIKNNKGQKFSAATMQQLYKQ